MTETRAQVAEHLDAARPKNRECSYDQLSKRMFADYGIRISDEQLRQYHRGTGPDPDGMNVEAMAALARYYGVELEQLSTVVAARWKKLSRLVPVGLPGDGPEYAAWDSNPEPTVSEPDEAEPLAA